MSGVSLDARLQRLWYGPRWRALLLWPLSLLYGAVTGLRRFAYRRRLLRTVEVPVPVIVVGNVTVGGTGKTPVAGWVAQELSRRGLNVGIVLRGYGGSHRGLPRVVELSDNPAVVGDEALLHRRRGAGVVVIGADRAEAARLAARHGAQVVVADDGLQHLRLARDYEIAVVDGARGLGNGWLLPAGPLREPARRLEQVNAVVVTERGDPHLSRLPAGLARAPLEVRARFSLGDAVNLHTGERRPLHAFAANQNLHAVAGIGNPRAFFDGLAQAGLDVTTHALPDHGALDPARLPFPADATVLMTEKDAVKCAQSGQPDWWWVQLEASLARDDAATLLASILERTGLAGAGVLLG